MDPYHIPWSTAALRTLCEYTPCAGEWLRQQHRRHSEVSLEKSSAKNSYDLVPYPSGAFRQTHPDHLAALATLYGMNPAPAPTCRVLELGCASGGNLIPMAVSLPTATFVGIDYSRREIDDGLGRIAALGLSNLSLRHMDILDVSDIRAELGTFDYILVHGVFSWVPEAVRLRILEICRDGLSNQGVAYISYNAYPGWHIRQFVRGLTRFHVRNIEDPKERARQARSVLAFAENAVPAIDALYKAELKGQLDRVAQLTDEVLLHDELGDCNQPYYFHEFMELAGQYDLQFLTEADPSYMRMERYAPQVQQALSGAGDLVVTGQYLDFLGCRPFRQTLLCPKQVALQRSPQPNSIAQFSIQGTCSPVSKKVDLSTGVVERFQSSNHVIIGLDEPLSKAALLYLHRVAPQPVPFESLLLAAYGLLDREGVPSNSDREGLGELLLAVHGGGMVELHLHPPSFAATPSERPRVSALLRHQIQQEPFIVNLLHQNVHIEDPLARFMISYLDGQTDRAALLSAVEAELTQGRLVLPSDGQSLRERIEANLHKMAKMALLQRE